MKEACSVPKIDITQECSRQATAWRPLRSGQGVDMTLGLRQNCQEQVQSKMQIIPAHMELKLNLSLCVSVYPGLSLEAWLHLKPFCVGTTLAIPALCREEEGQHSRRVKIPWC